MKSLWLRLSIVLVAVLTVSLAAASLLAYQLLLHAGRDSLDDSLRREATRLQNMVTAKAEDHEPGPDASPEQVAAAAVADYLRLFPDTQSYLTVTRLGSQVLTAPNTGPEDVESLLASGRLPAGPDHRVITVHSHTGPVRTLTSPVVVDGTRVASFEVAGPLRPVQEQADTALRRLAAAAIASLLLGAVLVAGALRRGLRPLSAMSQAARTTNLDDLSARVPHAGRRDELGVLAREFNRMLERLDAATTARRELVASVSHELRTPITICLGHLEMLQRLGEQDPDAVGRATMVVREELVRLRVMVEDLLAMARSETGDFVSPRLTQLSGFLDDLRLRVGGLQIDGVTFDDPPEVEVRVDPERLGQAVLNLIINARTHTPAGTEIHVGACVSGDGLRVAVTDGGRGFDPAIRARAFDPFVRGPDPGRGGHGLGLAVVRAVVSAHSGRIDIDTGPHGTRVTLILPQHPPGPPAAGTRSRQVGATPGGLGAHLPRPGGRSAPPQGGTPVT